MSLAYVLACAKSLLKSNGAFFEGNTGTWSGGNFIVAIDGIAFNENITMDSYVLWRIGVATGLDTTGPSLFNPLGTCRAISEADAERLNNAPYPYPKGTCRAVKDSCVSRGERRIEVRWYTIAGKAYDHALETCRRSRPSINHRAINLLA